ncbi:MAG TPA: 6-bladed beta-propeller [Clostridiales bacterium]|nr:6-bladed beta-propeller [Clostridiales bacterium]
MKKLTIVCAAAVMLLVSCADKNLSYKVEDADGVRVIINHNGPADPDLKIDMSEPALTLDLNAVSEADTAHAVQLNNVELDARGNVYVLDSRRSEIHKFDPAGKRVKIFGGRGTGPGEFLNVGFFVVWHDTVYVPSPQQLKIIKFDTDGNFITDKRYSKSSEYPGTFWKTRNFVTGMSYTPVPEEGPGMVIRNLNLFDDRFNCLRTFREDKFDFQDPVFDLNFVRNPCVSVTSDSMVYLPRYSENEYAFDVFDFEGNKKMTVKKRYQRIPYTEGELARIQRQLDRNNLTAKGRFKNSIVLITMDKYDRLWVQAALPDAETRRLYDIFKDGVYQNTVEVQADSTDIVDFVEDKLVVFDAFNNKMKYYNY